MQQNDDLQRFGLAIMNYVWRYGRPFLISLFALIITLYLIVGAPALAHENEKNILDYDETVLQQYLWFYPEAKIDRELFKALLEGGDPNQVTTAIFRDLYDHRNVARTRGMIDEVIKRWDLYKNKKLVYKFPYGKLSAGWWSGMDNLTFPMLLIAFSQISGEEKYRDLASEMLETVLKSPEEGGVLWRDTTGCWFSEYSWPGMRQSDEYYVLNGNLFSLEALKLVAMALKRSDLENIYECVVQGTRNLKFDSYSRFSSITRGAIQ